MPAAAGSRRRMWEKAGCSWLCGLNGLRFPAGPVTAGQFEILLRVHFHVLPGGIGMSHGHAGLDHLLQQENQVGLLENGCLAEWLAGELLPRAVEMLAQQRGTRGRESRDAGVFTVRLCRQDAAV